MKIGLIAPKTGRIKAVAEMQNAHKYCFTLLVLYLVELIEYGGLLVSGASLMYRVRDRDIIQDADGRLFVVLGYIQPASRVLSFLKYVPSSEGRWVRSGQKYKRIFYGNVKAVVDGLELVPDEYLIEDTHFGTTLLEVPYTRIIQHYRPDERLNEIIETGPSDRLEEAARGMALAIHDILDIPTDNLGVAGSIAWRGHSPEFSDVNMNVYGYTSSWHLQRSFERVCEDESVRLRLLSEWDTGISRVLRRIPALTKNDLRRLFARRYAFYYNNQCIGITPVLRPEEAPIRYSSETYTQLLSKPIKAVFHVKNADFGIFHPSLLVGMSDSIKECDDRPVERIMVYDGAFTGLFSAGDKVEVCGTLQKVKLTADDEHEFYQLMVGTKNGAGLEYVRLIE
ncbi:MAG: hypothetical protein ACFFEF_02000 [Candidatus Thorarchaeota archaeon]